MRQPCSWLMIRQGWRVVAADGTAVGSVAQVQGDKNVDIFDGLSLQTSPAAEPRYVPAESVGAIYDGEVTLTIGARDVYGLDHFETPPPVKTWRPGKPSFAERISSWFRPRR